MANYSHPEALVETDWVKQNLDKPGIKLVEIDVDTKSYDAGHIPGAAIPEHEELPKWCGHKPSPLRASY